MNRRWEAAGRPLIADAVPKVMGIVNVTPDSFSDGGRWFSIEAAVEHALKLVEEGADILDVGGESTRPGSEIVPAAEEIRRVVPVIEQLAAATSVPISIDTMKPEVAREATRAGACIINDVSGLRDEETARVAVESGAAVVVMHMQGTPQTMQDAPRYDDVVEEVLAYLAERVDWCTNVMGIPRERIAIDPGIGFGKTYEHHLELLRNLGRFGTLECAMLLGVSRKGMLKTMTGRGLDQRLAASVVCSLAGCTLGAQVVRVHDVGPMVDAIKVWNLVRGWGTDDV
ncbi:dihydropteroate synthase [Planctomyces sp. SH-PL62]|uniref:dihydropteroate synthase n=1 Tax=Planctomyces sp. SH-PL62 TaxID=1636152 RepID=UPI00078DB901|nr:dihydropteroate synthase [Planctomyces sp. SH-PL62]AMV36708.1 Dihydropteroate synthase [Planctomyces sp. SH-PL62]